MTLCGVINIDKPTGQTSREIVDRVLKIVRPTKVGHAGTLDPLATGVLVVCVGHATRLIDLIHTQRKRYLARFELGRQSDTDDVTGQIKSEGDWQSVSESKLKSVISEFVGRIEQIPPQFSAVHIRGQRAYQLARRGESVELTAKTVDVFSIRITELQLPIFEVEIECGSGTYIRSIGRDIGLKLGCGAIMTQLKRLAVGPFIVDNAISIDDVNKENLMEILQSPLAVVRDLPIRRLSIQETIDVRCGRSIPSGELMADNTQFEVASFNNPNARKTILVDSDGQMLGIAELGTDIERLQPRIIFPQSG